MTQRKPRSIESYTMNAAVAGLGGFEVPLKTALRGYFQGAVCEEISALIHDAVIRHQIEVRTNEDRKITKEQRKDRHELIETMKELDTRLFYLHIPTPLYDPARHAYRPCNGGKPTLGDEIADLLFRLRDLRRLFESIEIPTPSRTNPGKSERNRLVDTLTAIFDDFAKDLKYPENPIEDTRRNFIEDVFQVFYLQDPIPRNA